MSNEKDIKDGAVDTATEKMTTEMFHAQLVKNTEAINKEREEYEHKRAELQQDLDDQKTFCSVSNRRLQTEKLNTRFRSTVSRRCLRRLSAISVRPSARQTRNSMRSMPN